MKHITQVLLLLLLGCQTVLGQSTAGRSDADTPERRPSEILIQISGELSVWRVIDNISGQLSGSQQIEVAQVVARDWGVYLLQYRNIADERQLLELVRRTPGVRFAQWNCRVPDRSTEPNDPEWWRQADMSLIGAPEAWDVSTGGLTPQGDTIVVAILEKGTMLSHPDLAPNRWHNWAEIPDNGIDDDNNGYVDDFGGWDARNDGDNPGANNHGTAVTGIVGARGNNSTGVTGVNWHVQLLNISNAEFESEIVAAYYYVGNMRKLYNTTNGAKGAFVVATNASFGLDREPAEDHPLWCATYDSLGKAGIIGVGATTNANTDVDAEGDMPTSCTSEFLISVNNTNQFGSKMPSTGFGKKSIDLGAPGNDTYTTSGTTTPDYATLGGTSSATPHVTGAVGLLYSMQCDKLTSDALTDPVSCARRVRDVILDNVEPEPTLDGITTTGGYLQIANAVDAVRSLCNGQVGPLSILEIRTSADRNQYDIFYQTPNFEPYSFRVFNMLGQLMHEETLRPQQFGINHLNYDASDLPRGVYVISLSRGNAKISRKFPKI